MGTLLPEVSETHTSIIHYNIPDIYYYIPDLCRSVDANPLLQFFDTAIQLGVKSRLFGTQPE